MEPQLRKIGRIIFALPIGVFGLNHLFTGGNMAGMVPSFIPGDVFWIYFTGIALLAAAISIIIGRLTHLASLLLALLLLIFVLTMHIPSLMSDSGGHSAMINLLKDIALIGSSLLIAGVAGKEGNAENEQSN